MTTRGERLKQARKAAGFSSSKAAAEALDVPPATLNAHERAEAPGGRDFGPAEAKKYGRKFKVEDIWLLTGKGKGPRGIEGDQADGFDRAQYAETLELERKSFAGTVPIVGYVGAGAEAHYYAVAQAGLDRAPAPIGSTPTTVCVEVRGPSIGEMFDRWLVYYDDVRSPITADLIGKLCVVGLPDSRILIKKIRRSKAQGRFDLLSENEAPIEAVVIEWAAKVKQMAPQ